MQRVLIADDNSNIQKMVSLALKDAGIEVVAVNNGEAAVRKMPEIMPDLVLADIFMPVRSGYEVCEFIKRDPRFMQTPVILLAGAFDPFDEREAQRVQADGVLKKPFVPPDPLVNMVTALLSKAAGERLVPVGVAASHSAQAEVVSQPAPVREAAVEQFTDDPPEEFKMPSDGLAFADDKTLAFGALLETPAPPVEADSVVTAMRDPVLGDPAFWAPTEANDPASDDELTEGHSWEEPVARSAEISHVQPPDLDQVPELPLIDYEAKETNEPVSEPTVLPSSDTPGMEWPSLEALAVDDVATEQSAVPETIETEPSPEWPVLQDAESDSVIAETETSSYAAEVVEEAVTAGSSEELVSHPDTQASPIEPEKEEIPPSEGNEHGSREIETRSPETEERMATPDTKELPAIEPLAETHPAPGELETANESRSHSSLADQLPTVEQFAAAAQAEVASAPDFSAIFALAKTDLVPAIESEIRPFAASPSATSLASATTEHALAGSVSQTEAPGPELIEAVVARVIERMQPKMIEIVTREILRPVVEALVRREIEKK